MTSQAEIGERNDLFRSTFIGGKVVLTPLVYDSKDRDAIIAAVQCFDLFTEDNDPYKEHDFGKVTINGENYFWKIDYYDDSYKYFQKNGNRVLTIMHTTEY